MATLDKRSNGYRLIFYYQGVRFQHPLKTEHKREAAQLKTVLERNLDLVHQGTLRVPDGADLPVFLLSGGQSANMPSAEKSVSLGKLLKDYRKESTLGKEENTRYTERIHVKHLLRVLGRRTALRAVPERLQEYVNARSADVAHVTIKKELGTLSTIWNKWALPRKLVSGPLTLKNLEYAKKKLKPPFQTWEQIERKVAHGASRALWESVFLTAGEIEELLEHVRTQGSIIRGRARRFPFVFAMFALCAYTGARRSELLRSRREDFDFSRNEVTIREKKKDTSREETYRHVPMTPALKRAMLDWFGVHPGGEFTFTRGDGEPVTVQMASHHFRWAVEGSKWSVLPGYHTFRHSLISNLACAGVGERVIQGIVGHLNPETTRRYTHLYPSTVQDSMGLVFGAR